MTPDARDFWPKTRIRITAKDRLTGRSVSVIREVEIDPDRDPEDCIDEACIDYEMCGDHGLGDDVEADWERMDD